MGTARKGCHQNACYRNVIDKAAATGHQRPIFEAQNARADRAHWPALDIALAALASTSLGVA